MKAGIAHHPASRVTARDFSRAIRLMARGLLHPELLITSERRLSGHVDREETTTIKVVLDVQRL